MTTTNNTTTKTTIKTNTFTSKKGAQWKCIDKKARIYGLTVRGTSVSISGKPYTHTLALRIDGRDREGYRVDSSCMLNYAWVAIDEGQHFRTLKEAKAFVKRWLRAADGERVLL